jgi:hypothetical protein
MESLTSLANKYGTDKGTKGPSSDFSAHNYTDIYEAYLWARRHEALKLLEVGLGVSGEAWHADVQRGLNQSGGASVKMWYEFLPKARIYGLDINTATFLDNDRISTHVVDQSDREQLVTFAEKFAEDGFDVIIDDGSHRPDHQQITLSALFGYLKPGGLYFIEDLMFNGIGDRDQGRYTDRTVLNTRRVLKSFAATGSFADPNKLHNPEELAAQIDGIGFHLPRPVNRFPWKSNAWQKPTRLLRPVRGFREGTENILVLHRT